MDIRYPARLTAVLVGLVVLCLATGLAGMLDVQHRRGVLVGVAERSSLLASAAATVYQSLSDADARATGSFLAGDQAPPQDRQRYRRDVIEAASALSTAAAGAPDVPTATRIAELTAQLPSYTALVDTAGTYNRQGLSVGAAYLREASELVRGRMLPVAQQLYRDEMTRLGAAQDDASSTALFSLLLGILALAALVVVQIYLQRTTNRLFNAGLLVATAATFAALVWLGFASASAAEHNETGRRDGSAQFEALVESRITVLAARSEEALSLVARGSGKSYEDRFGQARDRLDGDEATTGAFAAARARIGQTETLTKMHSAERLWRIWLGEHEKVRTHDADGKYNEAIKAATGVDPTNPGAAKVTDGSTGQLSAQVVDQLGAAMADAQARFDDQASRAGGALTGVDIGIAVLALLAAGGVVAGMALRIREYR
nr:hypothetical protein [Kibdelosporangium sp. MJ126-NF4]CEL13953.1 secreted protein [Kibdelosporangium sp. MJ126-NF4]CTQ88322.1 secreted protein [Kibdelosporangium sp. MJ126-NF4]